VNSAAEQPAKAGPASPIDWIGQIAVVSIADIEVGARIGLQHPDKAAALGRLIAVDGQREPIVIRPNITGDKPWRLVTGWHRMAGMALEGLTEICAIAIDADDAEARAIEASENLHRRTFEPIERACFVRALVDAAEARLAAVHDGLNARQRGGKARHSHADLPITPQKQDDAASATVAGAYSWEDSVADAIGLSARAIYMDLQIHRQIVAAFPDLYAEFAKRPPAKVLRGLLLLCKQPPELRRKAIEFSIAHPGIETVEEALDWTTGRHLMNNTPTGTTKWINALQTNLSRMGEATQRQALPIIVEKLNVRVLREARDLIDARLAEKTP